MTANTDVPQPAMRFEELEAAIRALPEESDRGTAFEQAVLRCLAGDPVFGFKQVWAWRDWPGRTVAGFDARDLGIDVVGERHDGTLTAVQAKFVSNPNDPTPFSDLATFIATSARPDVFAHRMVVTNAWARSRNVIAATAGQGIGWVLRDGLLASPINWAADRPAAVERLQPRPHQRTAVDAALACLERHARAQLVMASSSGKTLTYLWIAEALGERILVLVPTLSLLGQIRRAWYANAGEPFVDLVVCSDASTVDPDDDSLVEWADEIGTDVTTDPAAIAAFLAGSGRRVVFGTYQSSDRIAAAMSDERIPPFDLAICDEAHRLASPDARGDFATILHDERIRARRRLFGTATPRVFGAGVKTGDDERLVASMDDEALFGPVAHMFGIDAGVAAGVLSDYEVVLLGVTDAEVAEMATRRALVLAGERQTDARTLVAMVGLEKAIATHGLRSVLTFHSSCRRAQSFAAHLSELGRAGLRARHVTGAMSAGVRAEALAEIASATPDAPALLASVRCLAEGIDIPSLDAVFFADPHQSPTEIAQKVGRVTRPALAKEIGRVYVAMLIPDGDADLKSLDWEPLMTVVRALQANDGRLGEEAARLRFELGRTRRLPRSEFFEGRLRCIDVPARVDLDRFREAVTLRVVRTTSSGFDEGAGRLRAYLERTGTARVPQTYVEPDGYALGSWVNARRQDYRRGMLGPDRVALLEAMNGWSWDPFGDAFDDGLAHLRAFLKTHEKRALVKPTLCEDGYRLGEWVAGHREDYRHGRLQADRIAALEAVDGWTWDPLADDFAEGLAYLVAFVKEYGSALVPDGYVTPDGYSLGMWVGSKRLSHRKGRLSREWALALEAITGWSWDPKGDQFDEGLRRAQAFAERNGGAQPTLGYLEPDGFDLYIWVAKRRNERRQERLAPARIAALEAIPGWTWDPRADMFAAGMKHLRAFVAEFGHTRPPQSYRSPDGYTLGSWASVRRAEYRKGRLAPDRIAALEAVPGWAWGLLEAGRADRAA